MKNKIAKFLGALIFAICCCLFLISLFACIPPVKTTVGKTFFNQVGSYINAHSPVFFLLQLSLASLALLCFAARFYLLKYSTTLCVQEVTGIQKSGINDFNKRCDNIQSYLNDLEIAVEKESPTNLRIIEYQSSRVKMALVEINNLYKDNLRGYYDNNRRIYKVVQATQLNAIKEVRELIITYSKL